MSNRYFKVMEAYFKNSDIARNNANFVRSINNLAGIVVGEVMKDYQFDVLYKGLPTKDIHNEGWAYLHQTFLASPYCIGLSSKDIAMFGLQSNAKNERSAKPPKRIETFFMQAANLICLIAQEVSGATSLNDLATIGAGYLYHMEKIGKKTYTHYDLKNIWQEFLFNVNLPFRTGNNSPFSNITLEFGKPNPHLAEEFVVYGGEPIDIQYKDIPEEYYNRMVDAFIDAMSEGDSEGRPFTFPLITVNLYPDFDWDNEMFKKLLEKSDYFGGLYFQNYQEKPFKEGKYVELNKFIEPFDIGMIYSNCCYDPKQEMFVCSNDGNVVNKMTIKEFFEKHKKELIKKYDDKKQAEWYSLSKDVYVPALNMQTGKIENKKVTKLLKIVSDKKMEVVLRNGSNIVCEPTHPFIVFDFEKGELTRKYAHELSFNDYVAVLDTEIQKGVTTYITGKIKNKDVKVEVTEDIAWLIGLFYAEGCYARDYLAKTKYNKDVINSMIIVTNLRKQKSIDKAEQIINKYFSDLVSSTSLKIQKWEGKPSALRYTIYGRKLSALLEKNGVVKYKTLPAFIKNAKKEVVTAFVDGFLAGDGYKRPEGMYELHINDKELIKEISALLWKFNIKHTLRFKKNSQTLRFSTPDSANSCYGKIPTSFVEDKKDVKYKPITTKETVSNKNLYSDAVNEYITNAYELVKVEKITAEKFDKSYVFYDIEVEDNHTFVLANGIIGSNCRMTFDISDVVKYTGSNPFHSNSGVGGVGVYNINMNRLLFLAKDDFELFTYLFDYIFDVGVKTLQRKRQFIREHWEDLFPYLSYYQKTDKSLFNIFSVVGVQEGLINAGFKDGLKGKEGKEYALKLANYIREKIESAIEETGELFSLEYAPSENAACKLAEKDIAFARKCYDMLQGKKEVLSKDKVLDDKSKFVVETQGEKLFTKIAN